MCIHLVCWLPNNIENILIETISITLFSFDNRYEFVIIFNHLEKTGLLRRKETIFAMESASPFAVW